MRRSMAAAVGAVSLVLVVAGCGHEVEGAGKPKPKGTARVEGLDGEPAGSRVFTARELLPMLLDSKGGRPGTTGDFGSGMRPQKGEVAADCPAAAKDAVAELYRISVPRAVQFVAPHAPGEDDGTGPTEQLVAMNRDQAARYMALKRALAVSCPQTTVTAVGFTPIAPQTERFRQHEVELGDEAYVEETTTWDGGGEAPSARPDDGVREYAVAVRLGGVIVFYGDFPSEAAALAGGAKAAAHARAGLIGVAGS